MTDLLVVLGTAALFAVFGLFVRTRTECPGSDACRSGTGRPGCGGCAIGDARSESRHA
jgi:hypothetical protein